MTNDETCKWHRCAACGLDQPMVDYDLAMLLQLFTTDHHQFIKPCYQLFIHGYSWLSIHKPWSFISHGYQLGPFINHGYPRLLTTNDSSHLRRVGAGTGWWWWTTSFRRRLSKSCGTFCSSPPCGRTSSEASQGGEQTRMAGSAIYQFSNILNDDTWCMR